jgi:hypothetical protein
VHGGRRIITHVGAALYRGGEPERAGQRLSGPLGQIIESVNDTFKGQLDLERHGGHIPGRRAPPRPAAHPRADRHLSQRPGGQPVMRSTRWS